jgi:RNA-directed DNA polymerase
MDLKLLSTITETHPDRVYACLEHPKYEVFQIPKKSGGKRTIHVPEQKLKNLQKLTNVYLNKLYNSHSNPAAFGFIKKTKYATPRDIVKNASMHIGKRYVWNIDLEDFFHSLNTFDVWNALLQFGISNDEALPIALLCCIEKKLPMGAPTSPVISNMACTDMDWKLKWYCDEKWITYTRYADDLTFSSNIKISDETRQEIMSIVSDFGFRINPSKERMQSQFGAQWVTGIKVNEKPNVSRIYIRTLRAILHDVKRNGIKQAAQRYSEKYPCRSADVVTYFIQSVSGKIRYVGFVKGENDSAYQNLWYNWQQLL